MHAPPSTELHVLDHPARPAAIGENAPLVVLVHGSLDRAASFGRVVRRLGDLHVVTYDRRGYARSRDVVPPAMGLDDHVADLLAILRDRPAIVGGHSYGGTLALCAADRRPDLIRALVVYEPPLPWMPFWPDSRSFWRQFGSNDSAAAAEAFMRRMTGDVTWERLPDRTKRDRLAEGPALLAEMSDIRREIPPFSIDALDLPVVVGVGSRTVRHQRAGTQYLADHIPGADLVEVAGAGHGAHLTHPDAFAALVRRAVDRAVGRAV